MISQSLVEATFNISQSRWKVIGLTCQQAEEQGSDGTQDALEDILTQPQ
jgi:hypothetical protein